MVIDCFLIKPKTHCDTLLGNPKRKNALINYDKPMELVGVENYDQAKQYHKAWVVEYLSDGNNRHNVKWTKSIAACPVKSGCFI